MSFSFNNKFLFIALQFMNNKSFIDSFHIISFSLDILAKNNLQYLSQEFDNNVLDLIKLSKKDFIHINICAVLKSLKKITKQRNVYISQTGKKSY